MGASHTTLVSEADESPPALEEDQLALSQYAIEQQLLPASGRMMRTYRLKHKQNASMVVLKTLWSESSEESDVQEQRKELQRIKEALRGEPHVAPYLYWYSGTYRFKNTQSLRPLHLLRPCFNTTLSDRLASRPFLVHVEKMWIAYQILQAVDAMHSKGVVHGFLTTENVGLSSWNWVVITDVASYKSRTRLPDDDPSDYVYYFQEHDQLGSESTRREKRCYLAPERFYSPKHEQHSTHNARAGDSNNSNSNKTNDGAANATTNSNRSSDGGMNSNSGNTTGSTAGAASNLSGAANSGRALNEAMDIFSTGCVFLETFLNGERAMDLGDLMEYRKMKSSSTLQQKLNKLEYSALRAACRHMLHLDPTERLSASAYLERFKENNLVPESFELIAPLMRRLTFCNPDHRMAVAAAHYDEVVKACLGFSDPDGARFMEKAIGSTMAKLRQSSSIASAPSASSPGINPNPINGNGTNGGTDTTNAAAQDPEQTAAGGRSNNATGFSTLPTSTSTRSIDLLAETEALLRKLENLSFDDDDNGNGGSTNPQGQQPQHGRPEVGKDATAAPSADENGRAVKTPLSQESLLIYHQVFISNCSYVQRPTSRLVSIQAMKHIARLSSDEIRLQRIVPVAVSLLHDQDSLVRALAIRLLASTLSLIESFPPSDSKLFPQYIFKRIADLNTDPSLVVRIAFAENIAVFAEISMRFLDISHAVQLYEAVGGGNTTSSLNVSAPSSHIGTPFTTGDTAAKKESIFADDVANLLVDGKPTKQQQQKMLEASESGVESSAGGSEAMVAAGRTIINSTYNADVSALQEFVSRWVVHVTTDQSEHSSPTKRALLKDLPRLCNFFGLDGVMAFILPQILSFLNDRKDWQLRSSLFESLPSVCHFIGRAATEHYVLPCLETALVDAEETVVCTAIDCLNQLLDLHLLSRSMIIGVKTARDPTASSGLLKKYGVLLIHPSKNIRHATARSVLVTCKWLGFPDSEVFVVPLLQSFLRFHPSSLHLQSIDGILKCLSKPWSRERYQDELDKLRAADSSLSPNEWTSIGFHVQDGPESESLQIESTSKEVVESVELDDQTQAVVNYLKMVTRGRAKFSAPGGETPDRCLQIPIEGSMKQTQNIRFPRQDAFASFRTSLPPWYQALCDAQEGGGFDHVSPAVGIKSVSGLGQVYGLSIMGQSVTTTPAASTTAGGLNDVERAEAALSSNESKVIDAAFRGEWGAEVSLDPNLTDTTLLITKLNALKVPTLPPNLGHQLPILPRSAYTSNLRGSSTKDSYSDRSSRIDRMLISSSTMSTNGHTAPVVRIALSSDQRFFATASHDGTCQVWEPSKIANSSGFLGSSVSYTSHRDLNSTHRVRINDLCIIDGGHSIVSGASDGSVHAWRVDLASTSSASSLGSSSSNPIASSSGGAEQMGSSNARVIGSTRLKHLKPDEGEVLVVNHFNSPSASVMLFGTQKGNIHSWDLRSPDEPFVLKSLQGTGYLTSMALGNDRNWVVSGTSKGYLTLWDLRFRRPVKVWQHSRESAINRLATSFVTPPQTWGSKSAVFDGRPFAFVASGPNECGMFDLMDGSCRECFRTVDYDNSYRNNARDEIPRLREVAFASPSQRRGLLASGLGKTLASVLPSSFHSLNAIVGSIGAMDSSFLITGGSDGKVRHWDFANPSKCYVSSGLDVMQPNPSFERVDLNKTCRLMICRQAPSPPANEFESERRHRKLMQGATTETNRHTDSIQDLKLANFGLISCSRDCTVKVWK